MAKLLLVDVERDENKNTKLTLFVSDEHSNITVEIDLPAYEFDAFFNMFAQIHQTMQSSNSNPFVTMREFTVSLSINPNSKTIFRKTEIQHSKCVDRSSYADRKGIEE